MPKRILDKFKSQSKKAAEDAIKLQWSNTRWAGDIARCVASRVLDIDLPDKKIKVCVQSTLAPRDADGMF